MVHDMEVGLAEGLAAVAAAAGTYNSSSSSSSNRPSGDGGGGGDGQQQQEGQRAQSAAVAAAATVRAGEPGRWGYVCGDRYVRVQEAVKAGTVRPRVCSSTNSANPFPLSFPIAQTPTTYTTRCCRQCCRVLSGWQPLTPSMQTGAGWRTTASWGRHLRAWRADCRHCSSTGRLVGVGMKQGAGGGPVLLGAAHSREQLATSSLCLNPLLPSLPHPVCLSLLFLNDTLVLPCARQVAESRRESALSSYVQDQLEYSKLWKLLELGNRLDALLQVLVGGWR